MRKIFFLLGSLADSDIDWIIAHGVKERLNSGAVLIREGAAINALYLVLDGSLAVSTGGVGGRQLARLGTGDIVGEMSFIDTRPPSATVTALENAVVLGVPRKAVTARLTGDSEFAARFYRALAVLLSHRLRDTNRALSSGVRKEGNAEDSEDADELDPAVLDTVHLAASRFNRVLKLLSE